VLVTRWYNFHISAPSVNATMVTSLQTDRQKDDIMNNDTNSRSYRVALHLAKKHFKDVTCLMSRDTCGH